MEGESTFNRFCIPVTENCKLIVLIVMDNRRVRTIIGLKVAI